MRASMQHEKAWKHKSWKSGGDFAAEQIVLEQTKS
jgi:hypothetical protein